MKVNRHPDPVIDAAIDRLATEVVRRMTPRDRGQLLYPDAIPVPLSEVPKNVVADHRDRYTQEDLETGQFLEVLPGTNTFIMSLFKKIIGGRSIEDDKIALVQHMESMATEAERVYRNFLQIYTDDYNAPIPVSGRGLFKARLYVATFMVQSFIILDASAANDFLE